MRRRYLTADWIYPVSAPPVKEGVVVMDNDQVVEIIGRADVAPEHLEVLEGVLIPGFINTHCHLELSHLKGLAPTGTGLLPFLRHVVTLRHMAQEVVDAAVEQEDSKMWEAGIQAVGDICNKPDTFAVKRRSPIRYYSFVEFFDFQQAHRTEELIKTYAETHAMADGHFSAVPHAPYSVSPGLFKRLREMNPPGRTISIHNQETPAEEVMFMHGAGPFREFYADFGFPLDHFLPTGLSSLQSTIPHLDPDQRTLFVHNTLTTRDDIRIARLWSDNVYWATCPNANLYIENRLPDYQAFLDTDARLTIGTDSLTSNWQLSILEEMKAIARYQSYVPFDTLLRWATLNGAEALGFDHDLGSIEPGKRPGILRLAYRPGEQALWEAGVKVERII